MSIVSKALPRLTAPPGVALLRNMVRVPGGSFLMGINDTLERLACPPDITYWFYWDHNRFRYVDRHMRELTMDAKVRRQSLLDADVIIFEENEAALPDSRHGDYLMKEMQAIRAGQQDATVSR